MQVPPLTKPTQLLIKSQYILENKNILIDLTYKLNKNKSFNYLSKSTKTFRISNRLVKGNKNNRWVQYFLVQEVLLRNLEVNKQEQHKLSDKNKKSEIQ